MSYERLRPTFTFDADRLAQLKAIVPEAFADGAINWEALRAALGDHLEDEDANAEHFGLFWPGKRAARRRASEPSRGTLIPVPGEGANECTLSLLCKRDEVR
jgi:adenine-specific DNA-methyltransferase